MLKARLARIARDPLTLFVALGALVFVVHAQLAEQPEDLEIEVSDAVLTRIGDQWQAQAGRAPTASELDSLVESWIQEEILYREALRMGLDRDDTIVRRRLAQKLAFLSEDLAVPASPDEDALRAYFQSNRERYRLPHRMSFSHVYFSADRHGAEEAHERAAHELESLPALAPDAWRNLGDPFILSRSYAERTEEEVKHLFGPEFASALAALDVVGEWRGPIGSPYGAHLVRIEARSPARELAFDEVRDRVRDDYLVDERKRANEAFYQALRERYRIRRMTDG